MTATRILALIALLVAFQSPGSGASFECTKTASPRERLICADQTLSNLDSQLSLKYKETRALLSPSGAKSLQDSQKKWLRFVSVVCPLSRTTSTNSWNTPTNCLQREYRYRIADLSRVQQAGPFVFNRVDLFAAEPSSDTSDDSGSRSGFRTRHVGYPQIDGLDTSATRVLNKLYARTLSDIATNDCGSDGDDDIDYRITSASKKLISITWSRYTYCHGTAHGFGSSRTENIVLQPAPHKLNSADLFGSGTDWVPKLQALFWDGLQKQGWSPPTAQEDSIKDGILQIVVDPERWQFTEDGIEVGFMPYEGGCYVCSPQPVTVSWDSLKPLLVQHAPIP